MKTKKEKKKRKQIDLELLSSLTSVLSDAWVSISDLPTLIEGISKMRLFQLVRRSEHLRITRTMFIDKNWKISLRNKYFNMERD